MTDSLPRPELDLQLLQQRRRIIPKAFDNSETNKKSNLKIKLYAVNNIQYGKNMLSSVD